MSDVIRPPHRARVLWVLRLPYCALLLCLCWQPVAGDEPAAPLSAASAFAHLRGTDLDGNLHRFADAAGNRGTAFVFLATECPISNGYLPTLKKLAADCRRLKIEFYGVISDPSVNRADAQRHRTEYKLTFPVLFDVSGDLRRHLHATHTPQAFVVARSGEQVYSGRIDNLYSALGKRRETASVHDFRDACQALSMGRPIANPVTEPIGCLLEDPQSVAAAPAITFNRDIAPIVYANCSECHHPGEAAPFALLDYADTSRHALQIATVTQSRFMPPWHPTSEFGHFQHERRLSDGEVELIRQWVAEGKPEGDPGDLLAPPTYTDGWRLGRPDLILRMKATFELGADGPDVHQHFVLPTGLTKHRLVSALEFRPGNPRIVHHACFYVDTSGAARKLEAADPDVGFGSFSGAGFMNASSLRSWLPGMTPQHLPDGTGQPLHARSDLVLEIHYRRTGKVESDRSTVGLHFAPQSARNLVGEIQVMNKGLTIPAGAANHKHSASYTLVVDATLLDTVPHLHLLGREMKATATRPDGTVEPLVWIKSWDFNWQGQYLYAAPIRLPRGTRIDVDAWYDNSVGNLLNPHSPPKTVRWGEQSQEEMAICQFRYMCATMEDLVTMNDDYLKFVARQQQIYEQNSAPAQ
jgi:hypothetical protein